MKTLKILKAIETILTIFVGMTIVAFLEYGVQKDLIDIAIFLVINFVFLRSIRKDEEAKLEETEEAL